MSSVSTIVVVTVVYCIVNFCATISPPTYKSPPIPTPPPTTREPVIVDVADVVPYTIILVAVIVPVDEILPVSIVSANTTKLLPVEVITALVSVVPITNVFITNPPLGAVDKVVPPKSIVFPAR